MPLTMIRQALGPRPAKPQQDRFDGKQPEDVIGYYLVRFLDWMWGKWGKQ